MEGIGGAWDKWEGNGRSGRGMGGVGEAWEGHGNSGRYTGGVVSVLVTVCTHIWRSCSFFLSTLDPWHLHHSKSNQRLYFYNKDTHQSVFETPQGSVAAYR